MIKGLIVGDVPHWIESYLNLRKPKIKMDGHFSDAFQECIVHMSTVPNKYS